MFPTQFSAPRPDSAGGGGSSNPSPQTSIHSSSNSEFSNTRELDAIDLNNDEMDNLPAWLNVSTDPIVGTNQKDDTFWNRIHNYCEEYNLLMKRGVVATKKRWYKINKARFTFERHRNMLRLEPKWSSQIPTQSGGSKRTKITSTGAYSSSSNPETPLAEDAGIDSPVCPQGSKKSKRRGKGKAQMSKNLSETKSSVVKKLSLIEDFKIAMEKEFLDERENRENVIAIKENELQIQQ
ncbi:hypothetical protein PIB30_051226 [Stylosanthes scabra]|uniref:No apical meristem-associated C-terminal domain-containing protein n=1 Tax=Stylosanthes scabra TaxID=79078 RepID=A0ABU6TIC0_9FABA|nr:hypothetical protein [Stylosanthes scabra]